MTMTPTLCGIEVRCMQSMIGQQKCVKIGGVIHVSPAQWDLLKHANGDELKHLLQNLPMIDFDGPPEVCSRCDGECVEVIGVKVQTCSVCQGTGYSLPKGKYDFTSAEQVK